MKLDTLSKQCIIAAAFAIALCIDCILMESLQLWINYKSRSDDRSFYITLVVLKLFVYVAAALISILKIIGIKKRRANLVVPWMLAAVGALVYYIYDVMFSLKSEYYSHLDFLLYLVVVFGVSYVILYPLLIVFADIRRETTNAENQQDQNKKIHL